MNQGHAKLKIHIDNRTGHLDGKIEALTTLIHTQATTIAQMLNMIHSLRTQITSLRNDTQNPNRQPIHHNMTPRTNTCPRPPHPKITRVPRPPIAPPLTGPTLTLQPKPMRPPSTPSQKTPKRRNKPCSSTRLSPQSRGGLLSPPAKSSRKEPWTTKSSNLSTILLEETSVSYSPKQPRETQ